MLDEIGDKKNIPAFIEQVKAGHGRLMGFGHRVYKSYDPRATLVKKVADSVFEVTGLDAKPSRSHSSWSGSRSRTTTSSRGSSIRTSTSTRG